MYYHPKISFQNIILEDMKKTQLLHQHRHQQQFIEVVRIRR